MRGRYPNGVAPWVPRVPPRGSMATRGTRLGNLQGQISPSSGSRNDESGRRTKNRALAVCGMERQLEQGGMEGPGGAWCKRRLQSARMERQVKLARGRRPSTVVPAAPGHCRREPVRNHEHATRPLPRRIASDTLATRGKSLWHIGPSSATASRYAVWLAPATRIEISEE